MQDTPIPILAKAPVFDLHLVVAKSGLSIGDSAEIALDADGRPAVSAWVRHRVWGFPARSRLKRIGHLGPVAGRILAPHLISGQDLRVRIVGLTPEYLAGPQGAEVFVSVWGVPVLARGVR
jgi:hypothetical protein